MNKRILEKDYNEILNYLKTTSDNITSEDFYLLTGLNINVPDEVITKNKDLYSSPRVLYYYLKHDPLKHTLFSDGAFSKKNIDYIIGVGTKYQSINSDYDSFLLRVFRLDLNTIKIFPSYLITNNIAKSAISKGYILTKEDIDNNEELAYSETLMNYYIYNNPELIKYKKCNLMKIVIEKALSKITLTSMDLENNPSLCNDELIMELSPNLKAFSSYLSTSEKILIIENLIKERKFNELYNLPFFDNKFNKLSDKYKIKEILNNIFVDFKDTNMNNEEEFFKELNQISESITIKCYKDTKGTFKYNGLVDLYFSLKESFTNDNNYKLFRSDIENFINLGNSNIPNKNTSSILEELDKYYNDYGSNITLDIVKDLLNNILNEHRNSYLKYLKYNINIAIKSKLNLTDKKYQLIINSLKINYIKNYIIDNEYYKFNTSKKEIEEELINIKRELYDNKKLIKSGVIFSEALFDLLEHEFYKYGLIREEFLINDLNINNKDACKLIINKFEQIKIKFISRVEVDNNESIEVINYAKDTIGFNINNFKIVDENQYIRNLSTLLVLLNNTNMDQILENKSYKLYSHLLLYLNILEDFNINNFISILINSDKITSYLKLDDKLNYLKFSEIIGIASTFNDIEDTKRLILTDIVTSHIDNLYLDDYFDVYLRMLEKTKCGIPPIYIETGENIIESGNYSEQERLNIGVYYMDSCIDLLNVGGKDCYLETLTSTSGDIIIIRDKDTHEFKQRFLLIRRGNILMIIPRMLDNVSLYFVKFIAKKLMEKIIQVNDNIDYIFTPKLSVNDEFNLGKSIQDNRFVSLFPHADVSSSVYLVASKGLKKDLNFYEDYSLLYEKRRTEINYNPSEEDINIIKSLYYYLSDDLKSLVPYNKEDYIYAVCGEDWCYLINKDNIVEEYILPFDKEKAEKEIDILLNEIERAK